MVDNCDAFYFVKPDEYCTDIAKKNSISLSQFYAWNPKVGTSCGGLWPEVYVCVSIVGHSPTTTTAPPTTTVKPTPTNGIATPTPIQEGMVNNCDAFHYVVDGDGCSKIVQQYGISLSQFYKWNPAVGSSCSALWLETYVCVSIVSVNPVPTTTMKTSVKPTTTKPGNGVATPTPIQQGMVSNCKSFRFIKSGDNCASVAKSANISLSNFYRWNSGVGSNCEYLWLDTWYCVAVL
jgi:LysM repeat protein